jgi:hypothetical protein
MLRLKGWNLDCGCAVLVRVTTPDLEARIAPPVQVQAGGHYPRAVGSGVVVHHGSNENPGVPSSRF